MKIIGELNIMNIMKEFDEFKMKIRKTVELIN